MTHLITMTSEMNSNSQIQHWDHIPKAKWAPYKKTKSVTDRIKKSQSLPHSSSLAALSRMYYRIEFQVRNDIPITPVDNIMNLVASVDILRIGFAQIKNNKGTLTPGSTPDNADDFTNERLYALSHRLKTGTYSWNPVRRIYVEKPGKSEKRPLGLPDFEDKVVQAALRIVLECIYEPIFEKNNFNFGFRPHKDPNAALQQVTGLAQGTDHAVEGDIKGAYNDVNHNIMMDTLGQLIKDTKFLNLIRSALKAGIMDEGVYEDTFLGIPQGGIVSPLLFNIYMFTFDMFVYDELQKIISPTPEITKVAPDYERNRSIIRRTKKTLERVLCIADVRPEPFFAHCSNSPYLNKIRPDDAVLSDKLKKITNLLGNYDPQKDKATLSNWRTSYKKYVLSRLSADEQTNLLTEFIQGRERASRDAKEIRDQTTYLQSKPIKLAYIRYADDWIIFTSGGWEIADLVKLVVADFLLTKLKLTLSLEKTRVTHLQSSKVQFLGYEIYFPTNAHLVRTSKGSTQRYRSLQIHPDVERLEGRFLLKGYLEKKNRPREVGFLTVLTDHEIIHKYNQFIIGVVNYYIRAISYPSRLNRWIYIMYYSCLKTLACKHRLTVKKVIQTYGYKDLSDPSLNWYNPKASNLRIASKYHFNGEERWAVLHNYNETMCIALRLRHPKEGDLVVTPTIDFLKLNKVNFRTKFKSESGCAICGAPSYALHHIRALKHKGGRYTGFRGFDKIVAALGRKQLPICKPCHNNIHAGRYDGHGLDDLYDIRLVAPESLLRFGNSPSKPTGQKSSKENSKADGKKKSGTSSFVIDEKAKTFFSGSLNEYIKNK